MVTTPLTGNLGIAVTVADVMTRPTIILGADATVDELVQVMVANRLTVLPIVEGEKLVGVVCRDDLLRTLVFDDKLIASRVRYLLRDHAVLRRWGVYVVDRVVTVSGMFVDQQDRAEVVALVREVPGVLGVHLRMEHPLTADLADDATVMPPSAKRRLLPSWVGDAGIEPVTSTVSR